MSQIIIDTDRSLNYETNSLTKRIMNFFLVPILNLLPKGVQPMLRKSHKSADDIIEHATTHKALEILYGHSSAKVSGSLIQNFFKSIWLSTNNSKAVRNRLKLVKREMEKKMRSLISLGKPISIVSIASGSSRAIAESINKMSFEKDSKPSVIFVDKNYDAISYSQDLTKDHKYRANFEWIHDTAGSFFRVHANGRKFNIIEMVGLMDYFNDEKAIYIFSQIYTALNSEGILITANIDDNKERPF
ncbi:MAG: hypothetical protein NT077_01960, partial [Candidatus Taylorbacteria bacterium]|nr:hypothetical protein [Candidatus Taylorbacteria bacterium]